MLEKMFTTKMSANKKKLQTRFSKIRSNNSKASKIIAISLFAIILLGIICISVYIAVNNAENINKIETLYALKNTELQDTDSIGKIVHTANFTPYDFHSVEIRTNEYEKRIAIKFTIEDRAMHRIADDISLRKQSAVILSLVPEAEAVSCLIFDKYSEDINNWDTSFYGTYASRKDFYTRDGFEKFNEEYINNSTLSLENFKEYYSNISSIASSYDMSDYLKQQYDFIGKDYEFVANSGIGAEFLVDEDFLNSPECKEINNLFDVDIKNHIGFAVNLNKTTIRNFKTNEYKKLISLYYLEGDKTIIISQKIIDEDKKAEEIKILIQKLMEKTDGMVIPNAENMTYTQVKALQYQVNQGHFPWRLDPKQVIMTFLTTQGKEVSNIRMPKTTATTLTYTDGNMEIELYKPIDKSEKGIWIVRSYKMIIPAEINEITFYNINPKDNTLNSEIKKQDDGWYKLPSVVGSFINFDGSVPDSVTAYFTPTGTNMEQYKKQVGFAKPPFPQIPISIALTFEKKDTRGHLQFVYEYKDGTKVESNLCNVLVEH